MVSTSNGRNKICNKIVGNIDSIYEKAIAIDLVFDTRIIQIIFSSTLCILANREIY